MFCLDAATPHAIDVDAFICCHAAFSLSADFVRGDILRAAVTTYCSPLPCHAADVTTTPLHIRTLTRHAAARRLTRYIAAASLLCCITLVDALLR